MKVIVIGAGAAGLMAAHELAKKDVEVIVLETLDRIGGRIHTVTPPGFTNHIEGGAEFIHRNLPLTLQLLKKANLPYFPTSGKMYRFENGRMSSNFGGNKAWSGFYEKLGSLKKECTLQEFLDWHFSEKQYDKLREEVWEMAQGLDLADMSKLSAMSIREEWLSEEKQYRPLSGYASLLELLRNDGSSGKYQLLFNEHVPQIKWEPGSVSITTKKSNFKADAVIITASLGSYFKKEITFNPEINSVLKHFENIGFGQVIKIALEFDANFWNEKYPDLGFLFTGDGITFWSQLSQQRPVLISWIGDGYIEKYEGFGDFELKEIVLSKLSPAFKEVDVNAKLRAFEIFRYTQSSFSGGGYSWMTTDSQSAISKINRGIANTIWFAGEALYSGGETGTVEAALQSGRSTARKILKLK
jgi:monoamine oxidase